MPSKRNAQAVRGVGGARSRARTSKPGVITADAEASVSDSRAPRLKGPCATEVVARGSQRGASPCGTEQMGLSGRGRPCRGRCPAPRGVASAFSSHGEPLTCLSFSAPVYSTGTISGPRKVWVRIKRGNAKGSVCNTMPRTGQVLEEYVVIFRSAPPDP